MFKQQGDALLKGRLRRSIPWFRIGLTGVVFLSLALRFWGLGRFNTFVFDEVYYAKFANDYLIGKHFFNAHPPLSQYIIAIGIWLGSHLPFGNDTANNLTGSLRSTFSYRWLNALTGSFIPLVVAGVAYQLTRRHSLAFIAALFVALDGLFLVESRYALNNIYLVILGLLGQWCLLLALSHQKRKRWGWLALAGIFFGASAAIKWNGLWFLLGAYMVWAAAWVMRLVAGKNQQTVDAFDERHLESSQIPLQNLTQLNLLQILLFLGIIPALIYSLLWIPHIQMNPEYGFWEMQKQILQYHERIKDGPQVHPYCSKWYTWPLMLRPIAYFYETARNRTDAVPASPPLPAGVGKVIYDVHAIGNPILWWLSTAAIILLLLLLCQRIFRNSIGFTSSSGSPRSVSPPLRGGWGGSFHSGGREGGGGGIEALPLTTPTPSTWIALYLVLNYAANLLPWVPVTRCTFLYHYMGASVFAQLALACKVDRWLHSTKPSFRGAGVTVIFLIILAFVYWMPIYLGLPLSADEYKNMIFRVQIDWLPRWLQQWLPNWI